MREIAALAGRSDYEPKLAGREWKEAEEVGTAGDTP
jgi:hypothetical protein